MSNESALSDLGEFNLIARIVERLGDAAARNIVVPPGDDAAAWRTEPGVAVATIDALTEGNHWREDTMSIADVGWRTVAVNVSDLAAMGATPDYLLVAAQFADRMTVADIDAFTEGLAAACLAHGVRVAGGDVVRARQTAFTVAAYGHAVTSSDGEPVILRRNGARAGDRVAVSGTPGASAAGLMLLNTGQPDLAGAEGLYQTHRRPQARVVLGQAAVAAGVRCGMDVSDGLLQDLGHIAAASGVGIEVEIDALPLHPAAAHLLGRGAAIDLALGGGEDFELVLIAPEEALAGLATSEVPVTVIGTITDEHPGDVIALDAEGGAYEPPLRGWDQTRASGEREQFEA